MGSIFQHLVRVLVKPEVVADAKRLMSSSEQDPTAMLVSLAELKEVNALSRSLDELGITVDDAVEWAIALFSGALRLAASSKDRKLLQQSIESLLRVAPALQAMAKDEGQQHLVVARLRAHPLVPDRAAAVVAAA